MFWRGVFSFSQSRESVFAVSKQSYCANRSVGNTHEDRLLALFSIIAVPQSALQWPVTHIHTPTGDRCHARCCQSHWEHFNVKCLAQGRELEPPALTHRPALPSEPQSSLCLRCSQFTWAPFPTLLRWKSSVPCGQSRLACKE